MNFRINSQTSDIIISIYVIVTLFYRIRFENATAVSPLQSLVIGICLLGIPWSLIKLKVLNPNWFGLFNTKKSKQ